MPLDLSVEIASSVVLKPDSAEKIKAALPSHASVKTYVPLLPNDVPDNVVNACLKLREIGTTPIPHLPARKFSGVEEVRRYLQSLTAEAEVDDVLLIAGDPSAEPKGPWKDSVSFLKEGLLEEFGISSVGIAGHPGGHKLDARRAVPEPQVMQALHQKIDLARQQDISPRLVTQFGLGSKEIINWERKLRNREGVSLPVHIGVAGPCNLRTLIKYAQMCGVGNSWEFAKRFGLKQAASLAFGTTATTNPDQMVADLEAYSQQEAGNNLAGIHFFSFGGAVKTLQYLSTLK